MIRKITYIMNRLRGQLWFKPFLFCLISIGCALVAHLTDDTGLYKIVPKIKTESIEELLSTLSASMLVISIFAVGSMISAFNAASNTATPRSFKLIVRDDVSQTALSVFIGSFIYSVVAAVALKNGYYGKSGHFTLFALTICVFILVIITFLRWVERISGLGRMGTTIKKIEDSAAKAIDEYYSIPYFGGIACATPTLNDKPVFSKIIGYVLHVDIEKLQQISEEKNIRIRLNCLPGSFITPDQPILYIHSDANKNGELSNIEFEKAFRFANDRIFDVDVRFGFITLSEIASRALSPAVNDPGTVIVILNAYLRLFVLWMPASDKKEKAKPIYDRVEVPTISPEDLFNDAFRPILRDGANNIEVMLRLQKVLQTIYTIGNNECKDIVKRHLKLVLKRSEESFKFQEDFETLKAASNYTD